MYANNKQKNTENLQYFLSIRKGTTRTEKQKRIRYSKKNVLGEKKKIFFGRTTNEEWNFFSLIYALILDRNFLCQKIDDEII